MLTPAKIGQHGSKALMQWGEREPHFCFLHSNFPNKKVRFGIYVQFWVYKALTTLFVSQYYMIAIRSPIRVCRCALRDFATRSKKKYLRLRTYLPYYRRSQLTKTVNARGFAGVESPKLPKNPARIWPDLTKEITYNPADRRPIQRRKHPPSSDHRP